MLHGEILASATKYQQSDERIVLIFSVLFTWDLMFPHSSLREIKEGLSNTVKPSLNICFISLRNMNYRKIMALTEGQFKNSQYLCLLSYLCQ